MRASQWSSHWAAMCRAAARNLELLIRLGVTHVLNTAEGVGIRLY